MVGFALILLFLAGTSPLVSVASPLAGLSATSQLKGISVFPPTHPGLLCENPVFQSVCSRLAMVQGIQVTTPIGVARGASDGSGVNRFPVKYASAARWAVSTVSINWTLPTGATNASGLPLACPQPDVDVSTYTEDCLSMILYVPITLNASSRVPTLLWIHGVMQYRLGALGFMGPSGATNLAVKDTVNAMKFLANVVPSFGGSASKITLAGQSSGADSRFISDSLCILAFPEHNYAVRLYRMYATWFSFHLARSWVGSGGGSAFVGVYYTGATYPDNTNVTFCLHPKSVCHEDDIKIVFGTVPNPTAAQAALTTEMQARYKAFLATGTPNAAGFSSWIEATTTDVHAHQLGGIPSSSGEVAVGACEPSFWVAAVQYHYQVFGI